MVQRLLMLDGVPSPDSADALACAICHAQRCAVDGKTWANELSVAHFARSLSRLRAGRLPRLASKGLRMIGSPYRYVV